MGLGIGLLAHPAHAGHWDITYVTSGIYIDDDHNDPTHEWSDNRRNVQVEFADNMTQRDENGQQTITRCTASVTGDFKAVLTWVPSPGDSTPTSVIVREVTYAEASGSYYPSWGEGEYAAVPTISVSNPIEDNSITYPDIFNSAQSRISGGSRLIKLDVKNGIAETPVRHLEALAAASSDPDDYNDMEAELTGATLIAKLNYGVTVDDRLVHLIRSQAPAPKSEDNPTLDKDKDEWIEANGTRHGHSTYSYYWYTFDDTASTVAPEFNTQQFEAVLDGSWINNEYSWEWSPEEDGTGALPADTPTTHQQSMPFGTPTFSTPGDKWSGNPTGTSDKIINYKVSGYSSNPNFEKATARARYELKLHDEWELKEKICSQPEVIVQHWLPWEGWRSNQTASDRTYTYGFSFNSQVTQEVKKSFSVSAKGNLSGGLDAGKLIPGLESQGITLGGTAEVSGSAATEQFVTTNDSQHLTYTINPEISVPPGKEATPDVKVKAKREKYRVWHWNKNGFVGEEILTVDIFSPVPLHPEWSNIKNIGDPDPFTPPTYGPGSGADDESCSNGGFTVARGTG